jgi:hypothetical protein
LCPLLAWFIDAPLTRRVALVGALAAAYAAVIAPWAIRNTRLQQTLTIVDTMGGINLRTGNYEYTPDDRMWDAVMLTGDRNWIHGYQPSYPGEPVTEGTKDKWAQRKAFEYMRQHPMETLRRSVIKFSDFWGLERDFIAAVQKGIYAPPIWFAVIATVAILTTYVCVVTIGVAGIWVAEGNPREHVTVLLPLLVILAGHTLAFGHSRYHLPLIPLLAIYGSAVFTARALPVTVTSRPRLVGAAISVGVLVAIWIRQVALVDLPRIKALLHLVG